MEPAAVLDLSPINNAIAYMVTVGVAMVLSLQVFKRMMR